MPSERDQRAGDDERHVHVIGPSEFTFARLDDLPDRDRYDFHPLLRYEDILTTEPHSFDRLLREAEETLDAAPRVDGIIAFWDFPATCLAALLAARRGLPGPSLEAVLRCEHKLWARRVQREVVPDLVPPFERVDPFDEDALEKLQLEFPFWLKPIKSASSMLGFRIANEEDFRHALEETREGIHVYGEPFSETLRHAELPEDLARWGGQYCIAEGLIGGEQATLEGFVHRGEVQIHGIVDSIRHTNESTFSRYQYPSGLSRDLTTRMEDASRAVLEHVGYDEGTFNIEFFYDEENDDCWIVEVNPRISQSHAMLFELVDGAPNFAEMVSIAVGETPPARARTGYPCAAKLFYRTVLEDAIVTAVPSEEEIRSIEETIPGVRVQVGVEVGTRLSDLPYQESYSYELAYLHVGGQDEGEILQKYQECVDRLTFAFRSIEDVDLEDGHHRVKAVPQLKRDRSG